MPFHITASLLGLWLCDKVVSIERAVRGGVRGKEYAYVSWNKEGSKPGLRGDPESLGLSWTTIEEESECGPLRATRLQGRG